MSLRKPRKSPTAPKPAAKTSRPAVTKRAAAAITETPGQSVVAVPSPEPEAASMPPTDLDAVDVVVDIRSLDDPTLSGTPPNPRDRRIRRRSDRRRRRPEGLRPPDLYGLNLNSGGTVVVVVDDGAVRPGVCVVVAGSVGRTATHRK